MWLYHEHFLKFRVIFSLLNKMANYTASALLGAQARYKAKFEAPEVRRKQNPALMLALKNTSVTIPDHQELRKKDNRPVKAYVRTKRAASVATGKLHNHTGTKADSSEVTLAWVQFVEPFAIHLKQGQSNVFSYEAQLEHELMESARNIHSRAGTAALAYLQSNRSQLASVETGFAGVWDTTNHALEVTSADESFFFDNILSFMRIQNHRGDIDMVLDSPAYRRYRRIGAQGQANAVNQAFQILGINAYETTEQIDANYSHGVGLAMPEGTFGGLVWNDPRNRAGKGDYDSVLGGFGVIEDPLGSGVLLDFHGYTERSDGSSAGGGVQDEVFQGELTLTIGWALPPLSTPNESVVWEVALIG
jgi:hypothetical protein